MHRNIKLVMSISALVLTFTAFAQNTCTNDVLDWNQLPASPTFPVSLTSHQVNLTVTDPSGSLNFPAPITPRNGSFYDANGSTNNEYELLTHLATLGASTVTVEFDVSGDPSLLSFDILDVDGQESARFLRQEVFTISGSYQGNPVNPSLIPTSQMQVSGNTVRGFNEVGATALDRGLAPAEGVLTVNFDQPVDKVTVVYSVDVQAPTVSQTSLPGFAIANLNIVCAPLANISAPRAIPATNLSVLAIMALLLSAVGLFTRRFFNNK